MKTIKNFIEWLQENLKDNWMASYKANPKMMQQMYFMQNNLANETTFEQFFEHVDLAIVIACGVRVDTAVDVPQLIYGNAVYKTDSQIMKLATKLNGEVGIELDSVRTILYSMLNTKKQTNQNPQFDKSFFQQALDEIFQHEEYVLDFELMNYKKVIGKGSDGNNIYASVSCEVLHNVIEVNEIARAINLDVKPMAKELIKYLDYYNNNLKQQALAEIIESTKYNPELEGFFEKFAKYVHETYNASEDLDVFTVGLKHQFWLIKRLSRELSTHNDLVLAFRGSQGIGKGFLVNCMFGTILGKFYNPSAKVSDIVDERWTPALGNMLLVNIDESDVGGTGFMNEKAMAPLKGRITNDRFTYRPMYTNKTVEVKKKASFISTSNFPLYTIMNDSSGMRRFLEFNSKNAKQQRFDYARTAKIAELALKAFQSVDENNEYGYWDINDEVGKKITAIQETYVTKTPLVEFTESLAYEEEMRYEDCISLVNLYDAYVNYCRDLNLQDKYIVNKKNFRRDLENIIPNCSKMHGNIWKFKFKLPSNLIYSEPRQVTTAERIQEIKSSSKAVNLAPDDEWMKEGA